MTRCHPFILLPAIAWSACTYAPTACVADHSPAGVASVSAKDQPAVETSGPASVAQPSIPKEASSVTQYAGGDNGYHEILTAKDTVTLPDLSPLGITLDSGVSYTYLVSSTDSLRLDDYAARGLFMAGPIAVYPSSSNFGGFLAR